MSSVDFGRLSRQVIRLSEQALYVMVDPIRSAEILDRLEEADVESVPLLDLGDPEEMDGIVPVLAGPFDDPEVLARILRDTWDQDAAVIVSARGLLGELAALFRTFAKVQVESGVEMLFRFHDPVVLRAFLPTCSPGQLNEFMGSCVFFCVPSDPEQSPVILRRKKERLQVSPIL